MHPPWLGLAQCLRQIWRTAFVSLLVITLTNGCATPSGRDAELPPLFEQLSEDDLRLADLTLQKALSVATSDTTFAWRNTANGYSGTVTPKSSFQTSEGKYCRTYVETVTIERKSELYNNTACMDDSGVRLTGLPSTGD